MTAGHVSVDIRGAADGRIKGATTGVIMGAVIMGGSDGSSNGGVIMGRGNNGGNHGVIMVVAMGALMGSSSVGDTGVIMGGTMR